MAYVSRRDRKRAHGGATIQECPAEVRDWRHGKPLHKYRKGGAVEGEAAKRHLGKRARGGKAEAWDGKKPDPDSNRPGHVLEGKEAADFPDGVDKKPQSRPEREVPFGSPRKRGGRAEGGSADCDERARGGGTHAFRTASGSVSAHARREAKGKGETMADGSFPIRNASDLSNAKHDVGRAHDPAAARQWINRRAKELGEPPLGG